MAPIDADADQSAADAVAWSWDLAANTMEASPGYRAMLGLSQTSRLRPFHILPLLAEADREIVVDSIFRVMAGEIQEPVTFGITLGDGTRRLVRGTAHVVRDPDGAPAIVRGRLSYVSAEAGDAGAGTARNPDERIAIAIVGADRIARLGMRSLLSAFPSLRVAADFAPTPDVIESLRTRAPRWRRFACVIFDVAGEDEALTEMVTRLHAAAPGTKIVARVQSSALTSVAWLVQAGVSRLVTSEVSDSELAQIVMDAAPAPADTSRAPGESYLVAGESSAFAITSSLSEAEMRVLQMLARGYRNREIAGTLFVSEPTVKRHTQQIYRKLGARDRAHAAALANRLRLA